MFSAQALPQPGPGRPPPVASLRDLAPCCPWAARGWWHHGRCGSRLTGSPVVPDVRTGPASRYLYLDNLKVVLIAAIIAMHGIAGYAGAIELLQGGARDHVGPALELALVVLALAFGLFLIALLLGDSSRLGGEAASQGAKAPWGRVGPLIMKAPTKRQVAQGYVRRDPGFIRGSNSALQPHPRIGGSRRRTWSQSRPRGRRAVFRRAPSGDERTTPGTSLRGPGRDATAVLGHGAKTRLALLRHPGPGAWADMACAVALPMDGNKTAHSAGGESSRHGCRPS